MSEANQELVRRHFEETEDFVEHAAAPFAQSAPGRGKGPKAMRERGMVAGAISGSPHDGRSGDLGRGYHGRQDPLGGDQPRGVERRGATDGKPYSFPATAFCSTATD